MPQASNGDREHKVGQINAIVDAVSNARLTEYAAWNDLVVLSSHTEVDGIDVDPAGIIVSGDKFQGLATIAVALRYDPDGDGGFETSDSFEGQFEGHFEGKKPVIDMITVNTEPFYQ